MCGSLWQSRRWRTAELIGLVGLLAGAPADRAQAGDGEAAASVGWREVWAGVDATESTWLAYSGTTIAPLGGIHDPGLRLRFAGGYGQYAYSGRRRDLSQPQGWRLRHFEAETAFSDALVGYLWRLGPLTAKGFVGAAGIGHTIAPLDPDNVVDGLEWGAKGVVELWLNIGDDAWASLDASYTTAHESYAARARLGYRILPTLSIGLEAGLNGNAVGSEGLLSSRVTDGYQPIDYQNGRGGAFIRYEWYGGELSLSAGVSGDIAEPTTPYATLNWLTQF